MFRTPTPPPVWAVLRATALFPIVALFLASAGLRAQDAAPDLAVGQKVYEQVCATCHYLSDRKGTGPGFLGVTERWNGNVEEMVKFIRKGYTAYVAENTEFAGYLKGVMAEVGGAIMPAQNVTEAEARAVLAYAQANSKPSGPAVAAAPGGSTEPVVDPEVFYTLSILVGVLLVALIALIIIIGVLIAAQRAKDKGEPFGWDSIRASLRKLASNSTVVGLGVAAIFLWLSAILVDEARGVGLHQGYKPAAQPIPFSHVTHANQYEIDCRYCHVGVEKGKSATIPSTNICNNCHHERGGIVEGPKYGKTELAKLLASQKEGKPIEWVRIHNLPDLVYFNHAQHVKVGGLECQQCHGKIQEMEEVYQFSSLSMGWCIDCHRGNQTKVDNKGNEIAGEKIRVDLTKSDYYRTVHGAYLGMEQNVTVEMLGGLDCAKCHY